MELYKVQKITEANYGCEECGADGPKAEVTLVQLITDNGKGNAEDTKQSVSCAPGDSRKVELTESYLAEIGIQEGKTVLFGADGRLRKYVKVVGAIIVKDGRIFATQRGYGEFEGGWEFPGGKVEPGETPEQAIVREIREELATEIAVDSYFDTVEYDYETFHLSMDCYVCHVVSGKLELLEHEAAKWLGKGELDSVGWLPADVVLVPKLEEMLG
ncbi:MAG: (deoxy)nucleoside triphosphate pyrophosphohydrolase [Lachnospiraceae bacterium]|nr:(deoxy)nucleoside triphosphate pyrophosphohydrolase [Lachnospiraceae bacterium]